MGGSHAKGAWPRTRWGAARRNTRSRHRLSHLVARSWGFWTRYKLELLQRYLDAFTTTTKNLSSKAVYLDLFGGEPENVDRDTLNPIDGSARIALNTEN